METDNDLSVKVPGKGSVLIVAVLVTYLIAGFITACFCGAAYLILY